MLHELVHTLGFVAACAPHHTLAGHVSDDPQDLMYAGPLAWQPSMLDVGRDDYFGHGAYCDDLATSDFLEQLGATPPQARLELGRPTSAGQPRAGRRFGVTAAVVGSGVSATCIARVAGRAVPGVRAELSGSRVVCGFRVPPRTRGKRLLVSVTVRGGGLSATRSVSFRVR
jgi:hypothetical protein